MALPASFEHVKQNQIVDDGCLLFIPSKSVSQQTILLCPLFATYKWRKKVFDNFPLPPLTNTLKGRQQHIV